MSLTITAAQFANADETAALCQTEDAGTVLLTLDGMPNDWAAMLETLTPSPYTAPMPPSRVPPAIADWQFAQQLAIQGVISQDEALAWAARGELPAVLVQAVAQIPEAGGQRFGATILLSSVKSYERSHPLVSRLAALLTNPATGQPFTAPDLDALWTAAGAL